MNLGDSFLMGNPGGQKKHLWIVISDSAKHGGHFVIVNLTSDSIRGEKTCVVNKAEHPWLTDPESYIAFGDALVITPQKSKLVQSGFGGHIIPQPSFKRDVVARIAEAAKNSKAFPIILKKYLD